MLAPMIERSTGGFRTSETEYRRRATELLTQFGLHNRLYHKVTHLSGGERQRVAIARALMNRPKILFADEPTGNLDSETGRQIMAVLEKPSSRAWTDDCDGHTRSDDSEACGSGAGVGWG